MKIESGTIVNNPVYTEKAAARPEAKPKAEKSAERPAESVSDLRMQQGNEENVSRRIKNTVDHANQTMRHAKKKCEFAYHEKTKQISIKIIDEETEEVIREIPPEDALDMLAKMWELAGLMVDEKR